MIDYTLNVYKADRSDPEIDAKIIKTLRSRKRRFDNLLDSN